MPHSLLKKICLLCSALLGVSVFINLQNIQPKANMSAPILGSSLDITSAYTVPSLCNKRVCPPLLWISVINSDGTGVVNEEHMVTNLYAWNHEEKDYNHVGTSGKNVLTPTHEIAAISFTLDEIPENVTNQKFYYLLESILGNNRTIWTIHLQYTDSLHAPKIIVSEPNIELTPENIQAQVSSTISNSSISMQSSKLSRSSVPSYQSIYFSDVPKDTLLYPALENLTSRRIIQGYSDGTFKPIQFVNRAEAAKFLLVAKFGGAPAIEFSQGFSDIEDGQWYTPYVLYASKLGIIEGYEDGTFRPGDQVSTVEFITMMTRTFELDTNLPFRYIDVDITDWYAPYVGNAELFHLLPKRPDYILYPQMKMTREEVALAIDAMLSRLDY